MNKYDLKHVEEYADFTNSAKAFKIAEEKDMRVVLPDEYTLQLDFDSELDYEGLYKKLKLLTHFGYYPSIEKDSPSKSGGQHKHVTIKLGKAVTQTERIILQQFLGSDPVREFLSYQRVLLKDPYPTLFFEQKERAE